MTTNRTSPDFDLAKVGYLEEEYFVSGTANVYDWAEDGTVSVKTPDGPSTTAYVQRGIAIGSAGPFICPSIGSMCSMTKTG
jgi:hypothetical protein